MQTVQALSTTSASRKPTRDDLRMELENLLTFFSSDDQRDPVEQARVMLWLGKRSIVLGGRRTLPPDVSDLAAALEALLSLDNSLNSAQAIRLERMVGRVWGQGRDNRILEAGMFAGDSAFRR